MSLYFDELWFGFIAQKLIDQCYVLSLEQCLACKNSKNSIILHSHERTSLLEKIESHFEEGKRNITRCLDEHYLTISKELPHTPNLEADRLSYRNAGRAFLLTCTPCSLYYGNYVSEDIDRKISLLFN